MQYKLYWKRFWKWYMVVLLVMWVALAMYITTPARTTPLVATSTQEDCLHYASTCDLRLHFLRELQQYRVSLYEEYGISVASPLRFLFFTRIFYYHNYMDRWWFLRYEAARRNPFMDSVLWGPGFDNYWENQTLRENIVRAYGNPTYFHVINVFLWQRATLVELKAISNETAIMELHDEAWCKPGEDCSFKVETITSINASLVGFAYPSEMLIPEWKAEAARRHMFHIPKTVGAERFYKPPHPAKAQSKNLEEVVAAYDHERDIDVLLIGFVHRWAYPIRWKVACMLKSGYFNRTQYKFYHKAHPGYTERTANEENISMVEAQIEEYASLMYRSKIVVTDSSRHRYAVGKYAEIPAAGALMMGDIPNEREDDFNLFVARISHTMTPDEIINTIIYWLEHPVERFLRARLGQIITLQKYTNDHSVDLMALAYLRFRQNRFGTFFAYPYADSCKLVSPEETSRYCQEKNPIAANLDLSPQAGWFLHPDCVNELSKNSLT